MGTVTRTFKRETTEQLVALGKDLKEVLIPWSNKNGYKVSVSISHEEEPTLKITVTNSDELKKLMERNEYSQNN